MRWQPSVTALILLGVSSTLSALCDPVNPQPKPTPSPNTDVATWLSQHKIAIRQTFDGSKNQDQPASFTWIIDDTQLRHGYYTVDAGIQLAAAEVFPRTNCSLLLKPIVEWHRDTTTATPTNQLATKLTVEFIPTQIHLDANFVPDDKALHAFFLISGGPVRDFQQHVTKGTVSFRAGAFSLVPGLPGGQIRYGGAELTYYPYLGVDWMNPIPSKGGQQFWAGVGRLEVAAYPIPGINALELLLDYTYRYAIDASSQLARSLALFIGSANLYFDAAHHIAIGYQFQTGHDSKDDFAHRQKSSLGLKIRV